MSQPTQRKRPVFLWFFIVVQLIFIVWLIVGGNAAQGQPIDCSGITIEDCDDLKTAQDVGTGLGIIVVCLVWFFVDAFLAIGYGLYRLAKRP